MNLRVGKFITQKITGEPFNAYIPPSLPLKSGIDLNLLYPYLEKATLALAELNGISKTIPNITLFIYMYIRKEALLSSQIEGTQSSFSDLILFENDQAPNVSVEDIEEVSHYVQALKRGITRLDQNFPLSLRLIKEIHSILLSGCRGSGKLPGEFRKSQNWIGGTRPGNAIYVPPPVDQLNECLTNFENFLHDQSLPVLIKTGIAHLQFESIHPFLDGNGRLGRLLISLLLYENKILNEPILYLSLYLKQNRAKYYELLQEVRIHGTWETWLEFFLIGIHDSAKQGVLTAEKINNLFNEDAKKINSLGRIRFTCEKIFELLKRLPQVNASHLCEALEISAPTARSALKNLTEIGILEEFSQKKRDKAYVYRKYLNILEDGAEPF